MTMTPRDSGSAGDEPQVDGATAYDASARRVVLRLAREAVTAAVGGTPAPDVARELEAHSHLREPRGCFVTLHTSGGELRGCIGCMQSSDPLGETLMAMGGAVTADPRFVDDPVTAGELEALRIDVSIISPLRAIDDPLTLRPGVDGIYIVGKRFGSAVSGCFLPQVASEYGWDAATFVSMCCSHKMGLAADAWRAPTSLRFFTFETTVITE